MGDIYTEDAAVNEEVERLEQEAGGGQPQVDEGGQPAVEQKPDTNAQLVEALRAAFPSQPVEQKHAPEPEKRLTTEEFEQRYKVWKPDDAFMAEFFSDDPKLKTSAFLKMRDGLAMQYLTQAQELAQRVVSPLQQRYETLESTYTQQSREAGQDRFFNAYPNLKDFKEFLPAISQQLTSQGFAPKTEKEAFEKLAQTAESVLKKANPNFSLTAQTNNNQTQSTKSTKMVTGARGGQGGTSGNGQKAAPKPAGMDVWD